MVLFFNILFILGFWDSCQCHQTTQPNSSSPPISSKNPNLTGKQKQPSSVPVSTINPHLTPPIVNSSSTPEQPTSPPLPQSAPIVSELEAQLPIRQFLSIFIGECSEFNFYLSPPKLELSWDALKDEKKIIDKLKKLQINLNEMDQKIKDAILKGLELNHTEKSHSLSDIEVVTKELSQQKVELISSEEQKTLELDKINQWLTIHSQYILGDIPSLEKTERVLKDKKLPFSHVLNLIFLIWKEFNEGNWLTNSDSKLHTIKFFSQIKARELLSLASIWLDHSLCIDDNQHQNFETMLSISNFCDSLGEEEFKDVISSWLDQLEARLKSPNTSFQEGLYCVNLLSQTQFYQRIFQAWINHSANLETMKQYFSEHESQQLASIPIIDQLHIALRLNQILEKLEASEKIKNTEVTKINENVKKWLKDTILRDITGITKLLEAEAEAGPFIVDDLISYFFRNKHFEKFATELLDKHFEKFATELLDAFNKSSNFNKNTNSPQELPKPGETIDFDHLIILLIEKTEVLITRAGLEFKDFPTKFAKAWTSFTDENKNQHTHSIVVAYMMSGSEDLIKEAKQMIQDQQNSQSAEEFIEFLDNICNFLKQLQPNNMIENKFLMKFKDCLNVKKIWESVKTLSLSTNHANESWSKRLRPFFVMARLGLWQVGQEQQEEDWITQFFTSEDLLGEISEKLKKATASNLLDDPETWIVCCSSFFTSF